MRPTTAANNTHTPEIAARSAALSNIADSAIRSAIVEPPTESGKSKGMITTVRQSTAAAPLSATGTGVPRIIGTAANSRARPPVALSAGTLQSQRIE